MTKYRFDPEGWYNDGRVVWVLDIGADLKSGQEFDPAEFGHPGWVPEPYPHPLFLDIAKPVKSVKPQELVPVPTPSAVIPVVALTGEGS